MKKKNFFLITQVFYPDETSTAGLFTNLCQELVKQDVNVEVWCSQPSYDTRQRQPSKVVYHGIEIHYLISTNFNKNNFVGRLFNYLTFSISLILKLLFSKSKTTIFTSTNPPYLGFLIASLCKIKKRDFNYIVQDVFPDGLIRLGKLSNKSITVKIWNILNRFTLKKAKEIVIIGRDMMNWINSVYPNASLKTHYIPIWQETNLIHPIDTMHNPFIFENKLTNKFIVQYSGNMGLWNNMKTIGRAVTKMRKEENIHFVFIGNGIRKKELEKELEERANNVCFFPFQPKKKLNDTLTACHISLVSLREGLEGIAVPSKIMGILAAGIPVLALVPKGSEIAKIVEENNCGIVIHPDDDDNLVQKILLLNKNEALRIEMGINARNAFEKKYNSQIISEEYKRML